MRKNLLALFAFLLLSAQAQAQTSPILGNPIASAQTATAAASLVAKATGGQLYAFSGTAGASAGYFLIFDATSAPSNGTVTPKFCYPVAIGGNFDKSWGAYPVPFQNGIVIEFSTTGCFSATSSSTAFITAQIR